MAGTRFSLASLKNKLTHNSTRDEREYEGVPSDDELMNPSKYAPDNDRRTNYRRHHLGE